MIQSTQSPIPIRNMGYQLTTDLRKQGKNRKDQEMENIIERTLMAKDKWSTQNNNRIWYDSCHINSNLTFDSQSHSHHVTRNIQNINLDPTITSNILVPFNQFTTLSHFISIRNKSYIQDYEPHIISYPNQWLMPKTPSINLGKQIKLHNHKSKIY